MKLFKQFEGEVPLPNNKASSLYAFIQQQLSLLYSAEEVQVIASILLEHYAGLNSLEYRKRPEQLLNQSIILEVHGALELLKQGMPLQQVVGWCEFYQHRFLVNQHVLIPRPETEELVEHVVKSISFKNPTILDIGTGSGCIAISLKKAIPNANIWAMEISPEALEVARRNAKVLEADVKFLNADVFSFEQWNDLPNFDIIVSNPPYIDEKEKHTITTRVKAFEPHIALFAPGTDPLIFYRKIAEIGFLKLTSNGQIWVEINERFGFNTRQVFVDAGYKHVELLTDLSGKHRFVKANH